MEFESIIYIVGGIIYLIYRYYKKSQKSREVVGKNQDKNKEQTPQETAPGFTLEKLFEEYQGISEEEKPVEKVQVEKPIVIDQQKEKRHTSLFKEKKTETPVHQQEKEKTEDIYIEEDDKVSDILRKYKERNTKTVKPAKDKINSEDLALVEPIIEPAFDGRQAFIYSEIFNRKY